MLEEIFSLSERVVLSRDFSGRLLDAEEVLDTRSRKNSAFLIRGGWGSRRTSEAVASIPVLLIGSLRVWDGLGDLARDGYRSSCSVGSDLVSRVPALFDSTSLPHALQPGEALRAKSSRRGAGLTRSMTDRISFGFAL